MSSLNEQVVEFQANGGAEKEPLWVSNISEMSEVTIEVGERTMRAKPTFVTEQPE